MSEKNLSKGEKKVIAAFDGNAKTTAKKCKLTHNYVRQILMRPYISKIIKAREEKELEQETAPLIADRKERQQFWSSVMRGDPQVVQIVEKLDGNGKAVLVGDGNPVMAEVKQVTDMKGRLRAAELLGRSNADFIDRVHVTEGQGVPKEITDEMNSKEASALYIGMLKDHPVGNA